MTQAREFEIIERYFSESPAGPGVRVGIGDDAAVIDVSGPIVVAVDTLVAGTHFPVASNPRAVGHRALAVNLSDLAAMGARSRWATLALSLPEADDEWLEAFAAGFFALASRYAVSLVGGDTTRGPLTITVQLIGEITGRPLLRSAGQAGDCIFVSGCLGDSAAGLAILQGESAAAGPQADALVERFLWPEPRVDLGLALAGVAHAAIDVSDGLVADLSHLCAASGCGAELSLDQLPLSDALAASCSADRALELALHGGDDYELCFSAPAAARERILELARRLGTRVTEIGVLTQSAGVRGRRGASSAALIPHGFRHFV